MDVSRSAVAAAVLAVLCGLGGCANFQTIGRSTALPLDSGHGKAVHLDAQQRLVVFTATRYCAEPSPDALAAYAAALGLSGPKLPSKETAASAAFNSAAGSIGLRTQSITLMRDTLYRICEERLNDSLSDEQIAVLLARSQDLTAVILAIEQLTGAVAAPPVTLTTGGGSSALASLTANTEALNAAKAAEAKYKKDSDDADAKQKSAKSELDQATTELDALRKASAADDAIKQKIAEVSAKDAAFQQAKSEAERAAADYQRMQQTTDQISQARDAANAVTTATVSSGAVAGAFAQRNLSDQAVGQVASTVRQLVTELLSKDYFLDTCLAALTSPGARKALESFQRIQEHASGRSSFNGTYSLSQMQPQTPQDLAAMLELSRGQLMQRCLDYMAKIQPRPYPAASGGAAGGTAQPPNPPPKQDAGTASP